MKKPFVTLEQLQEIVQQYPTPFHLYDEKGIRENARALHKAFSWNPGYKEYFAAKGYPFLMESPTNQQFPILPDAHLDVLKKKYSYSYMQRVDAEHSAVRFCTSWATTPENVDALIADIQAL